MTSWGGALQSAPDRGSRDEKGHNPKWFVLKGTRYVIMLVFACRRTLVRRRHGARRCAP